MLMLGNLIRESGVTELYVRTLNNHLLNILTLLIGISIGATATADRILNAGTILIICFLFWYDWWCAHSQVVV